MLNVLAKKEPSIFLSSQFLVGAVIFYLISLLVYRSDFVVMSDNFYVNAVYLSTHIYVGCSFVFLAILYFLITKGLQATLFSKTLGGISFWGNNNVNRLQNEMTELSEMAKIRNLHWWTVEYGLIGDTNNPKIYGAGLLSSIEESQACLEKSIKKIPYSIDAANINFDITKTQPQLFVIPDFSKLSFVLEVNLCQLVI